MASDSDWVADVRRWVQTEARSRGVLPARTAVAESHDDELGYEAAHPALQSRQWVDAQLGAVVNPK